MLESKKGSGFDTRGTHGSEISRNSLEKGKHKSCNCWDLYAMMIEYSLLK
jgi:hypothetical protein